LTASISVLLSQPGGGEEVNHPGAVHECIRGRCKQSMRPRERVERRMRRRSDQLSSQPKLLFLNQLGDLVASSKPCRLRTFDHERDRRLAQSVER